MEKDPPEALRSAELLHDQAKFLLEDEIAYATSLRESRRTSAGLLLLIVGVGVFRFEMYRPPGHVSMVPHGAADAIRWLFFAAFVLLGYGGYRIYTERPLWKELVPKPRKSGSALSVLNIRQEVLDDFRRRDPLEIMNMRTDGLRLAYTRLRDANRRVRARISSGTALVFSGLVLVLVAFGVYTFSADFNRGGRQTDDRRHAPGEAGIIPGDQPASAAGNR